MKKTIFTCDECGKEDSHPMALFLVASGLEWRLSAAPETADKHSCSRECAAQIMGKIPIQRSADWSYDTPRRDNVDDKAESFAETEKK